MAAVSENQVELTSLEAPPVVIMEGTHEEVSDMKAVSIEYNPDGDKVKLCGACFCCASGINIDMDTCVGCFMEGLCICCKRRGGGCIPLGKGSSDPDSLCLCVADDCRFFCPPKLECYGKEHCCCIDRRCLLPCKGIMGQKRTEVPMALACCFIQCFPTFGVFKSYKELGVGEDAKGGNQA